MKKKYVLILLFAIFIVFYSVENLLASFYFGKGQAAYNQNNYKKAYPYLNIAVNLNPKDRDYRYYYIQTLIKQLPTYDIQKKLYEFSQQNFSDSADLIADRQISKWKQQIFSNFGDNYIEQVPFNNKILRWDASKFPLSVYIETSSVSFPVYYNQEIKKAFSQWKNSTAGFVRFKYVDSADDADIVVKIVLQSDESKCNEESCKYVVAYTSPDVNDNLLEKMNITFYDSNNLSKYFTEKEIYNTALHEIGHALGIMGHSYNKDDLMYMENNVDIIYDKFKSDFQFISQIDLNTFSLLYKLHPDITNSDLSEFNSSHFYYAPIIMGSAKQINSRKLLEARNYIKKAPYLPNGYIDLSAAYAKEKEYNKAIEALQKALDLSSNDNERAIIYYNYAIVYTDIQDWENSLKYANLAKQIQPSTEIDGLIAGINFNLGNKELAKKIYIETIEKNPQSIIDSINLARIYLKELNLIRAGKTLNNLVKVNPQAKNDPRVKAYSILMFFFK